MDILCVKKWTAKHQIVLNCSKEYLPSLQTNRVGSTLHNRLIKWLLISHGFGWRCLNLLPLLIDDTF